MNYKLVIGVILIVIIVSGISLILSENENKSEKESIENFVNVDEIEMKEYSDISIFNVFAKSDDIFLIDGKRIPIKASFGLKEDNEEIYDSIKNDQNDVIVIIPTFTAMAYGENRFYQYFKEECDETCLTVKNSDRDFDYHSSANGIKILNLLDYEFITDIDVDKNPSILSNYEKIILLHNEYVTKKEFDAISKHENVLYLYPNALHAEINYDYENDEIVLIRGHGYPQKDIDNGFDWEFDNTRPYEFDSQCNNWEFMEINNGRMLNCYPEQLFWSDVKFLEKIKE